MQPLISFVLLTYNQSQTVEEALNSLLEQTYSPIEIIISDDCSTDDTWFKIQRRISTYNGKHCLKLNQNFKNIGINANYNKAFSLAKGELILIAAGDDVSLPERAAVTVKQWLQADMKPRLIAAPVIDMHVDGKICEIINVSDLSKIHTIGEWLAVKPYVIGASHAWHRSLFNDFPPLPTFLNHEDQIASYRAALLDAGMTLKTPLVKYRRGGTTQKQESHTPEGWLKKRKIDAQRDAEFWKQMAKDLGSFPIKKADLQKIYRCLARCEFEFSMIEAKSLTSQLRILLSNNKPDFIFRLRTFLNVRFAERIFKIKKFKK